MNPNEASDFKQKYPKIAAHLEDPAQYPICLYRSYGRILEKIESLWGNYKAQDYMDELLTTERADRQGFPPEVGSELFRLHILHAKQYPTYSIDPYDPFSNLAR